MIWNVCVLSWKGFLTPIHPIPWRNSLIIIDNHTFCICLFSLSSFIALSPQFIITIPTIRKSHSWMLLYGRLMYLDKQWGLMLISHYLIFKNNYVVPNFNYGMPCYLTISTSSWYVSMIGFMEEEEEKKKKKKRWWWWWWRYTKGSDSIHNHNHSLCTQLVDIWDSTSLQRILRISDVLRHLILVIYNI